MNKSNIPTRYRRKHRKSINLILLLISINLSIIYLISDLFIFLGIGIVTLLISMLFFIIPRFPPAKSYVPKQRSSIRDTMKISIKFIKMNQKYLFMAIIGLSISALIISQTILFIGSYQQKNFDEYLLDKNITAIDLRFDKINNTEFYLWSNQLDIRIRDWVDNEKLELIAHDVYAELDFDIITTININITENVREVNKIDVRTKNLNSDLLNELLSFPSIPNNLDLGENPIILTATDKELALVMNDTSDFENQSYISVRMEQNVNNRVNASYPLQNLSIAVDYIWIINDADRLYAEENGLIIPKNNLFINQDQLWTIYNTFEKVVVETEQKSLGWGNVFSFTEIFVELPNLMDISLDEYNTKIIGLVELIGLKVDEFIINYSLYFATVRIISPLFDLLEEYNANDLALLFIIILMTLPIILVSFYLLGFAFSLIKKLKEQLYYVIMTRGASNQQAHSISLFESIITASISSLVGMLLSIPLTIFELNQSINFTIYLSATNLIIPESWYWKLPVLGILISLNFSLSSMIDITSIKWVDNKKDTEPFWQKLKIPQIILILSSASWLLIKYVVTEDMDLDLLFVIGELNIILILLTLPLVFSSNFINLLKLLSSTINRTNRYVTLLIHNLHNNKSISTQFMSIIFASILISFVGSGVAVSMDDWIDEQHLYDNGAEILVEVELINLDTVNNILSIFSNLSSISGIEGISEVIRSQYRQTLREVQLGEIALIYEFIGINTDSFKNVAFWNEKYADDTLDEIFASIDNSFSGVGIQRRERELLGLNIGENHVINYGVSGLLSQPINLVTEFKYFPNLVDKIPSKMDDSNDIKKIHIMSNFDKILDLTRTLTKTVKLELYVKLTEDANAISVISNIENTLDINVATVTYFDDPSNDFFTKLQISFLLSSMYGILIFSFIINLIAISYYSFIIVTQRKQEFAIYNTLGMKNMEIKQLMIFEILIMIVSSFILAAVSGVVISSMIIDLLMSTETIQASIPIEFKYDFLISLVYTISLILITVLIGIKTINRLFSRSISNLLRE